LSLWMRAEAYEHDECVQARTSVAHAEERSRAFLRRKPGSMRPRRDRFAFVSRGTLEACVCWQVTVPVMVGCVQVQVQVQVWTLHVLADSCYSATVTARPESTSWEVLRRSARRLAL